MRALVTGGAGFIGSTLVDRLLAEGHAVDVVDDLSTGSLANLADARSDPDYDFRFHRVDIRAAEVVDLIERRRPEIVFHLAGADLAGGGDVVADAEVNVLGGLQVIEGAKRAEARKVVFASTASVYGPVDPVELPVRETRPMRPSVPHAVAKRAVGDYLVAYRERFDLDFTVVVPPTVYGPRQRPEAGVVAAFASRLLAGERCTIVGDGSASRDFTFVDDVVDAFVRAMDRGDGLVINAGTGLETTVLALHDVVAAAVAELEPGGAPRSEPLFAPPQHDESTRRCLDPGRAAIHLGWRAWTALPDGVRATVAWHRAGGAT